MADVGELVAFARDHLPRVGLGGEVLDLNPGQRCYYVELRASDDCQDRKHQPRPEASGDASAAGRGGGQIAEAAPD